MRLYNGYHVDRGERDMMDENKNNREQRQEMNGREYK